MKFEFLNHSDLYNGTQMRPLKNYLAHGILGNSCVAWVGPCEVNTDEMIDGEDLRAKESICGSKMLHFVFEVFDQNLFSGVCLQRLFADHIRSGILQLTAGQCGLDRQGDDLFWNQKKLSISIATKTINSVLIHFAVNVSNAGTPVPTCALEDFGIQPKPLYDVVSASFSKEFLSIGEATWKVRTDLSYN